MRLSTALAYGSLRAFGVTAITRRLRGGGLILCYHNVVPRVDRDRRRSGAAHVACPLRAADALARPVTIHVISLREFVDRLSSGRSGRGVAAVTFDDGYAGVFDYAVPVLEAVGIPATVFLVANRIDRTDGFWWDQPVVTDEATPAHRERWLKDLRGDENAILSAHRRAGGSGQPLPPSHRPARWATIRGRVGPLIDLGVHSASHRSLPTLTDAELQHEVVTSRETLHRVTGVVPQFFSYPYGLWDARVRERVRVAGYRAAVTLDCGLNGASADPWTLRRVNVPAAISDVAFAAWTAGFQPQRARGLSKSQ